MYVSADYSAVTSLPVAIQKSDFVHNSDLQKLKDLFILFLFYYSNRTVVHQEGLSSNLLFNVKLFTQQFTSIRFQS